MSRPTTIERKLSTAVDGVSTSTWETTATVKYLGHREVERLQSPYDLKRTQSYTSFREPEDLEYKKNSTGALKTGLHSIWDADGRMTVRERMHDESGGYEWGEVFRYDEMGRLTKMWYDVHNPNSFASNDPVSGTNPFDHKVDWTLGKVYERDSVVKTTYAGGVTTTNYTDNLHYQVTAGPATMAWNDNGHLTDRGSDDFAWTALGQLRQAAISGETARDYVYDAFGRRVKTVVDSQTNRFLYDGWLMIGEYDSTAGHWLWQEGPWCEGERMLEHVARDTNDLDTDSNVTEYRTYAVHEDFQDTVWGLSDTGAAIVERYFYTDPYGASETKNSSGTNIGAFATNVFHRKRLHGGFIEAVSGIYDFRNRWLSHFFGAWLARDPLGVAESYNLHQSFLCAPNLYSDPTGMGIAGCECDARVYCRDIEGVPDSPYARHCVFWCHKKCFTQYWILNEGGWDFHYEEEEFTITRSLLREGGEFYYHDFDGLQDRPVTEPKRSVWGTNLPADVEAVEKCDAGLDTNCEIFYLHNSDGSDGTGSECSLCDDVYDNDIAPSFGQKYRALNGPNSNTYVRELLDRSQGGVTVPQTGASGWNWGH